MFSTIFVVDGGGVVVVVLVEIEALPSRREPKTSYMDLLLLMRDISQILHKVDSVTQHIKFDMRYFYVVGCAHFALPLSSLLTLPSTAPLLVTITTTIYSSFCALLCSWFDCFKQQCCRSRQRKSWICISIKLP